MPVAPGARFGPYEILGHIGSGGMGEVYRARDPRLARDVAIKVLPTAASADADRLRRFELESRAAGALNHPNILTVFDTGLHDGSPYIVFELLRGETLRETLTSGPLPVRKAIGLAVQVADGLAAAHEAAVIHRDLKPENLFVTGDGRAKILDFGLAKLKTGGVSPDGITDTAGTGAGTVLGTVGYMSPEQVEGRPADARSDLFAFGAVLYEMLSGQRAFRRDSAVETLRAILKEDPPEIEAANAEVPAALRRIVGRCLEKKPELRFQSARDLAFALETLSGAVGPGSGPVSVGRAAGDLRRWWLIVAMVALVVGSVAIGPRLLPRRSPSGPRTTRVEMLTNRGDVNWDATISPDGRYLAYTTSSGRAQTVWLRDLVDRTEIRLVPPVESTSVMQFTPDSRAVYYQVQRATGEPLKLYRVPLIGGEPRLVRDGHYDYSLSPDGGRLGYRENAFLVADLEGGPPRAVDGAYATDWSSDGRQLLFARDRDGKSALFVADGDGGHERKVGDLEKRPDRTTWRPRDPTTVCLLAENHLFLVDLGTGALRPFGEPVGGKALEVESLGWIPDGSGLVVFRRGGTSSMPDRRPWFVSYPEGRATPIAADSHAYWAFSMTSDGRKLASTQVQLRSDVIVASPEGSVRGKVLSGTDVKYRARWTADGRIVYSSNETGTYDLYVCDVAGSNRKPLTSDRATDEIQPAGSPDGRYFVFVQDREGRQEIFRIDRDGTGLKRLTEADPSKPWVRDNEPIVTPDNRWVLYRHWDNGPALWKVPIEGGTPVLVKGARPANPTELVYGTSPSPDGESLAFLYFTMDYSKAQTSTSATQVVVSDVAGRILKSFPFIEQTHGINEEWRVQWSPDGRALYYVLPHEDSADLWRQPLAGGPPVQVTHFDEPIQSFDWSPDGKSIVVSRGRTVSDAVLFTDFH